MKKRGFTLIELLAVIVILAIIALIATPIILGIIYDSKNETEERSVELYASAVRNAIATYQLIENKIPTTFEDLQIDYTSGEIECETQKVYQDGSFYLEGCRINNGAKEYTYGFEKGNFQAVCEPADGTEEYKTEQGTKYNCKVDPNKDPYTFYVLNSTTNQVNLIMDSNININGEAVKGDVADTGEEVWMSKTDYPGINWDAWEDNNSYGPLTAMNHLQIATKNWTNLNIMEVSKFTDCDSRTTCTEKKMSKEYNMYARMPYLSEISDYSASANNAYLYDNLLLVCYPDRYGFIICTEGVKADGLGHIEEVDGYWTLSSSGTYFDISGFKPPALDSRVAAWIVSYFGHSFSTDVNSIRYGIRPVITLEI